MSEVKRFGRIGDMVEATEGILKLYPMMSVYVLASDFDRATAERDAALVRVAELESSFDELAASVGFSEARLDQTGESPIDCANQMQQRLTAADEREYALGSLVPEAELALKALNVAVSVYDVELADNARRGLRLIIAALKPAEGGGDEA